MLLIIDNIGITYISILRKTMHFGNHTNHKIYPSEMAYEICYEVTSLFIYDDDKL
jgi:hypothetical protein